MYMLNLYRSYDHHYSRLIVAPIVDQTCILMGLIHTNGQFIKIMIGVVMNSLMGIGLYKIVSYRYELQIIQGYLIANTLPDTLIRNI